MSWNCCFCDKAILDEARTPLSLIVSRLNAEAEAPTQALAAHGACLAERLAPSVPFDANAFAD